MLKIREPFYSAGKQYGWDGSPVGIGININLLQDNGILELTVGKSEVVYRIDKSKAREFVRKYNSYYNTKGVRLCVIAWSEFDSDTVETKQDQPESQISLNL